MTHLQEQGQSLLERNSQEHLIHKIKGAIIALAPLLAMHYSETRELIASLTLLGAIPGALLWEHASLRIENERQSIINGIEALEVLETHP